MPPVLETPSLFFCPHCRHAPFTTKKILKIHLACSKPCRAKEDDNRPANPAPRKFDLDDPEDNGDGDEPEGTIDDIPVNMELDHLFEDFYTAICSPDDDEPSVEPPLASQNQADNEPECPQRKPDNHTNQFTMDPEKKSWIHDFPTPAGTPGDRGLTEFEEIENLAKEKGWGKWGPFESESEWELGKWLFKNATQSRTNEFLKMEIVSLHFTSRVINAFYTHLSTGSK